MIQGEDSEPGVRAFPQVRGREKSWVLWLHEHDYAVILWERNGTFLLKTSFTVKAHKRKEFERDWNAHQQVKDGEPAPSGTASKASSTPAR